MKIQLKIPPKNEISSKNQNLRKNIKPKFQLNLRTGRIRSKAFAIKRRRLIDDAHTQLYKTYAFRSVHLLVINQANTQLNKE